MSRSICILPIVEGHGEVQCIRGLLQRIGIEIIGDTNIAVAQPIRRPRSSLVKLESGELLKAVKLARLKLAQARGPFDRKAVLILLDSDMSSPCQLAPALLSHVRSDQSDLELRVVLPCPEYETWLSASADAPAMAKYLNPPDPETDLTAAESIPLRKAWIERKFRGSAYSESVDQARLTSAMDLKSVRQRCASFDKLCRDLESLVGQG